MTLTKNNIKLSSTKGRTVFNSIELEKGERAITVPESLINGSIVNSKVYLKGKQYNVIGECTFSNFYIPIRTFKNDGYKVSGIIVTLNDTLSVANDNKFSQELHQTYPTASIEGPSLYRAADQNNAVVEMLLICIIYFISLLSFMFLMKYLVDKNNSENVIYSLVGASKKSVILIIFLENFIISFVTSILSIVLHISLTNMVFNHINMFEGLKYTSTDYFIIFCFLVIVSEITILPFMKGYYRNSIIASKNKYM